MKFLLLVFYFFRSVFLRGLVNTVKLLSAEIKFEKKFVIKTAVIKKSDSDQFFHYQGASYLVLLRIFSEVKDQTKHFEFVDIGCGKGRAIFVAEYSGYNRLTGIELDDQLLKEALQNEKSYAFKRKESQITFIHMNAVDVNYKNTPAIYFLFNPFNETVLRKVLEKICAATRAETWFVYMNPLYTKPFAEKNMVVLREFKTGRYKEALVYKFNPA